MVIRDSSTCDMFQRVNVRPVVKWFKIDEIGDHLVPAGRQYVALSFLAGDLSHEPLDTQTHLYNSPHASNPRGLPSVARDHRAHLALTLRETEFFPSCVQICVNSSISSSQMGTPN
jgi:hypothetical protein